MKVEVNNNLVLVGTAHVSKASVEEVESAIEEYKPDVVAVELDEKRFEVLTNKQKWEEILSEVITKKTDPYSAAKSIMDPFIQ